MCNVNRQFLSYSAHVVGGGVLFFYSQYSIRKTGRREPICRDGDSFLAHRQCRLKGTLLQASLYCVV